MKVIKVIIFLVVLTFFNSCQTDNSAKSNGKNAPGARFDVNAFDLALITDTGSIDDKSFNQGCWEGILRYTNERFVPHKYFQPKGHATSDLLETIDQAVNEGAKVIITPSVTFEFAVYIAQDRYPNVNFILVDSVPHFGPGDSTYKTSSNTVGILFAEDQAGFLAGYAAVKDGYRQLGFFGGRAIEPVFRFGHGFIQGVEFAAEEMGLASGSVSVNYIYTGTFLPSPEAQALAASWYESGTEVIFACGGAVGKSVIAAAEKAGKKVIGVDIDQSGESPVVITSALKGLQAAVYSCIVNYYSGRFPGGRALVFSAANRGVGLPMHTSRFSSFSIDDYNKIFNELINGNIPRIEQMDNAGNPAAVPVSKTKVILQPKPDWASAIQSGQEDSSR